jgi:hypothetical protein
MTLDGKYGLGLLATKVQAYLFHQQGKRGRIRSISVELLGADITLSHLNGMRALGDPYDQKGGD